MGRIHSGKGNLGVPVNSGEDIALLAFLVAYHSIKAEEKSGDWFALQLGDLFSNAGNTAFAIDPCLFCWFIIQA